MKALIVVLLSPCMVFFAIGALQTIEWCIETGMPVPFQAYLLLFVVGVWGIIAANYPKDELKEAMDKYENWMDRFFKVKPKDQE